MEDLNKVVSFILGLVVVVVFLAFISGRFKMGGKLGSIISKQTVIPTPISTAQPTSSPAYNKYGQTTPAPKTIPATGSPTILFPVLLSGAASGLYLTKIGKKIN